MSASSRRAGRALRGRWHSEVDKILTHELSDERVRAAVRTLAERHALRPRQVALVVNLVAGRSRAEIASRDNVTLHGVKSATRQLLQALGLRHSQQVVIKVLWAALDEALALEGRSTARSGSHRGPKE